MATPLGPAQRRGVGIVLMVVAAVLVYLTLGTSEAYGPDDGVVVTRVEVPITPVGVSTPPNPQAPRATGLGDSYHRAYEVPSLPRRPRHTASRVNLGGLMQDGVFYGLFHFRTRDAFDLGESILRGKTVVTRDRLKHPLSVEMVSAALKENSECGDGATSSSSESSHRNSAMMCALVRGEIKVVAEWLLWHIVTGWRRFVIYDDGDNEGLAIALREISSRFPELLEVYETQRRNVTTYEQQQAAIARHCGWRASAAGMQWVTVMQPDEFFVVPNAPCAPEALLRKSGLDTAAAIAYPLVHVGHSGNYVDHARSQFERTGFVAGNLADGQRGVRLVVRASHSDPNLEPPSPLQHAALFSNETLFGGATVSSYSSSGGSGSLPVMDVGSAEWPARAALDGPRVMKFEVRSMSSAIYHALNHNDVEGSKNTFDIASVKHEFDTSKGKGSELMERGVARWLMQVHKSLLRSLHLPTSKRRERYTATDGGSAVMDKLFHQRVLVWNPESTAATSPDGGTEHRRLSNQLFVDHVVLPAPEPPVLNMSRETLEVVLRSPRCIRRRPHAVGNLTFCAYTRNRAKLTQEWVIYHRLLGVTHFHVFDDDSSDGLVEGLRPFIEMGFVSVHPAPEPPYEFKGRPVRGGLLAAYAQCDQWAAAAGGYNAWTGYTDSDEFIVLAEHECLPNFISDLAPSDGARNAGVALPWKEVGHSGEGVDTFPTQLVRTKFGSGKHDPVGRVKCIVKAGKTEFMSTAHLPEIRHGRIVLPDGSPLSGSGWFSGVARDSIAERRAYLIHYHTRSLSSWIMRHLDGFADNDNEVRPFDIAYVEGQWLGALGDGQGSSMTLQEHAPARLHEAVVRALLLGTDLPTEFVTGSPAEMDDTAADGAAGRPSLGTSD